MLNTLYVIKGEKEIDFLFEPKVKRTVRFLSFYPFYKFLHGRGIGTSKLCLNGKITNELEI